MANDDINMSMRGQKEIVNGKTVDKQGVHLDESALEAALFRVASGGKASTSNSENVDVANIKLSANAQNIDGKLVDEDGIHLSKDDLLASLVPNMRFEKVANSNKQTGTNTDFGVYQPIIEELQKIPFTENSANEVAEIAKLVKEAGMKLKIKKIITNTKAIAKNAEKFYYTNDSVRIVYSILGNKFSVQARGDFTGHEAVNLRVDGDSLAAEIYNIQDDGDISEVTKNYKIGIKKE